MEIRLSILAVFSICAAFQTALGRGRGRGGGGAGAGGLATTFNVMSYGAKPGKNQESTQAFIQAWNAACNCNGKAVFLVPQGVYKLGETLFQGPCKSTIPITFLFQGTLQAVSDPSAYTGKGWISFNDIHGFVLTGGGLIDGQGPSIWQYNDCDTNRNCIHLPASIYMSKVSNAKIKSINLLNSMGFHMHITNSFMVRLHSLTITAPEDSPNTDGMHISKSTAVRVSRSVIKTGDDCISVGQGATNVTINKITCGPGHGISVGSLGKLPNELDVTGLRVKNCTLLGTTNGIRIKTYPASDSSRASGMYFVNIVMENVKNPIIIDQNYGLKSSKPSLVKISDVIYQNIRGTTISAVPVKLICSSQAPCQNVHLDNINLQFRGDISQLKDKLAPSSACVNAVVGYSGVQIPPPCVPGASAA